MARRSPITTSGAATSRPSRAFPCIWREPKPLVIRAPCNRRKSCASRRNFSRRLGLSPRSVATSPRKKRTAQKNVIILTDAFWRQRFNSDPNVLGRDTRINGIPRKIVGVLPPAFRFLSSEARVFLPIKSGMEERGPKARHSGGGGTHMIARLKPGATIAEAQAQIDAHNAAVEEDNPEAKMMAEAGFRSLVRPLHAEHVRSIRPTLLLMQAGVFFLLLIGAVNLINLLLIRASGRAKEMAIRQSMGASRAHVVRQVVTETVLLTFDRRIARRRGRRVGNTVARSSRRESLAARRAYRVRWLARVHRSHRRRGSWSRYRAADRLVQPEQSSGACAAIGIAHAARSAAPRNASATDSSSRRLRSHLSCSRARRCSV